MRYEPVKLRQIYSVEYKRRTPGTTPTPVRNPAHPGIPATSRGGTFYATGRVLTHWQVRSNLLGDCGHKHRTEASAKPCLKRMKLAWSAVRSKQGKRAQRMQRETKLAANELLYGIISKNLAQPVPRAAK